MTRSAQVGLPSVFTLTHPVQDNNIKNEESYVLKSSGSLGREGLLLTTLNVK